MSLDLLQATVAGERATRAQAAALLEAFAEERATPEQLAAALTALRIRGESAEVLTGFADVLRARLIPVALDGREAVDLCGTGGDGQSTVNLSTLAAFVTAGAGVTVAKHGNHGVSSRTGSADVLVALGLPLRRTPEATTRHIREHGLGFIYAPAHHPLFAKIAPVRRALGFRTAFNLLGPVCNPAGVRRQVIGTFSQEAMVTVAEVLLALGTERALVVHTPGPYDEVSLTAPTQALEIRDGYLTSREFPPEAFGAEAVAPSDLAGGDAAANAERIVSVLRGEDRSGLRRAACANAACALLVAGAVPDLREGYALALDAVDSGAALAKLEALRADGEGA